MLRCAPPHQWWRCLINCHECSNQHPARVQPRSNRHRTPRPPATTLPPPLPPLHPRLPFPRPLPPPFPPGFVYGTLSADGRVRCDAMLSCASRMLPPAAPHTPPPPPSGRPTWSSKRSCSAASAAAYSRMSRGSPAAEQPSQPRTSLRRPRKWLGRTQRRQSHQALMVGSPASRQAACNLRQLPRNQSPARARRHPHRRIVVTVLERRPVAVMAARPLYGSSGTRAAAGHHRHASAAGQPPCSAAAASTPTPARHHLAVPTHAPSRPPASTGSGPPSHWPRRRAV